MTELFVKSPLEGRLGGTELELGVLPHNPNAESWDKLAPLFDAIERTTPSNIKWKASSAQSKSSFFALPNGGSISEDSSHVELSVLESRSPLGRLVAEEGTKLWLSEFVKRHQIPIDLFANVSDPVCGQYFGYHESYKISGRQLRILTHSSALRTFLSVRALFCGAGSFSQHPWDDEIPPGSPLLAEKLVSYYENSQSKPPQPSINKDLWSARAHGQTIIDIGQRLHIVCGDANVLFTSSFLKFFATELMIRGCLEKRFSLFERFYHISNSTISDLLRPFLPISIDPIVALRRSNHRILESTSAIELLSEFMSVLKDAYYNNSGPQYKLGFEIMSEFIQAFRGLKTIDPPKTAGWDLPDHPLWPVARYADWALKKVLIDKLEADDRSHDLLRRHALSMQYHALDRGASLVTDELRFGRMSQHIDPDEITRAMAFPRTGTRADLRALLYRQAAKRGSPITSLEMNFASASIRLKDDQGFDFLLLPPDAELRDRRNFCRSNHLRELGRALRAFSAAKSETH